MQNFKNEPTEFRKCMYVHLFVELLMCCYNCRKFAEYETFATCVSHFVNSQYLYNFYCTHCRFSILQAVFRQFDKDRSNSVDTIELGTMFNKLGNISIYN